MTDVLVIGRTGQVAFELGRAHWPAELRVECLGREALDLGMPETIAGIVARRSPRLVVNTAAYTAVDAAESAADEAFRVNRDGPAALAAACRDEGAALIHLSTDYVFDGTKHGPYVEEDPIRPLGVYGASKAEGEAAVREGVARHVILRTSWVYAPIGRNFVRTMLRLGRERERIAVVADQRGSPTSAAEIARAIVAVAGEILGGRTEGFGTFHFCGAGETSWHGFAASVFAGARERGLPTPRTLDAIATADYPTPAKRPANSVLDCTKLALAYGIRALPWQEALARCLDEIAAAAP